MLPMRQKSHRFTLKLMFLEDLIIIITVSVCKYSEVPTETREKNTQLQSYSRVKQEAPLHPVSMFNVKVNDRIRGKQLNKDGLFRRREHPSF